MTDDFFRARLDQMIDLRHPLAVLAGRMPWAQIEGALAPAFARRNRQGEVVCGSDLFGTTRELAGAGVSAAGRPRLPIRLMAALLYLKHAFNLSDEELVARWSENVVWQYFSGQNTTRLNFLVMQPRLADFVQPSAKSASKSFSRPPSTRR